jgi:TBC1 domain family member 24
MDNPTAQCEQNGSSWCYFINKNNCGSKCQASTKSRINCILFITPFPLLSKLSAASMESLDMPSHPHPRRLNEMVIGSVDTLCGKEINQIIPFTWNDQPPLLDKLGKNGVMVKESESLLKGMIRQGIPPALRCAVQLSNIVQTVHPHQTSEYWHEYRTLAKVRALDFAYDSLLLRILSENTKSTMASPSASSILDEISNNSVAPTDKKLNAVWEAMESLSYGRPETRVVQIILPSSTSGSFALKRVLLAFEQCVGVDYAPVVPILASILLTSMSESYAFTAMREMGHAVTYYFPSSRIEHAASCFAFGDILRKLHPQTASYLDDRGVLDVEGLAPIFQDFFVDVIRFEHVQRIMDIYTLEGSKVLYRFGVALLVLYKVESAEQLITISNADEWWHTMKLWSHSARFNFELVVRKAYGVHGRLRRQMRFPRRSIIQRIVQMEEDRIRQNDNFNDDGMYQEPLARPLGLVHPQPLPCDVYGNPGEAVEATLAQSVHVRQLIAQWLPLSLRLTNLDLLYSTSYHGRTLERFYEHVKHARHTFMFCEVLTASQQHLTPNGTSLGTKPTIIGMYASQVWRISSQVYGDGGCFLFRIEPNAVCWKWQPSRTTPVYSGSHDQTSILDHVEVECDDSKTNNEAALLEQFMVGTREYISMGGNPDGTCGLRINEDLTKGESSTARGFNNEPLHGADQSSSLFEIGLVEVYGLVRQIDGRPV